MSAFPLIAVLAAVATGPNAARVAELAEHLPAAPAWTDAPYSTNPKAAKKLPSQPIPDCTDELYLLTTTTGDRDRYQKVYFGRQNLLEKLAGAVLATGDERCLKRTVEVLETICAERCWTMPAHDLKLTNFNGTFLTIDLGASHRALAVAGVLSQLGDRLPADVRAKAMRELERRVFSLYRATNRDSGDEKKFRTHRNWWFLTRNNWNAVCHACVVRAALAVVEDRTDRAAFLEAAERAMAFFLDGFSADGYCSEGMGYWNYGFGNFLYLTESVRKATGGYLDFSRLPRARKAMEYAFGYTLDGRHCPVFADGGGGKANAKLLDIGCRLWPELRALREQKLPPRTLFPDAQVYIGRASRIAFGVKGGNNAEFHNHNDLGSWSLLVDGKVVAGDPSGEIYTARTFSKDRYVSDVLNSYGHPVPKVGGALQLVGAASAARIVRQDFGAARDVVAFDLSEAYPATRGKKEALVREVTFDRAENAVTIVDRLRVAAPLAFESAVITRTPDCPFDMAATGGAFARESKEIRNPGRPSPHRHAVVFGEPVSEATVTWTYRAR